VRAFSEGYLSVQEDPRVVRLKNKVDRYNELLDDYGMTDHQVAGRLSDSEIFSQSRVEIVTLLATRTLIAGIYAMCFLPGTILATPFFILAKQVSAAKAKEALAKSSVKLEANDVLATWKIMIGMVVVPSMHIAYTAAVYYMVDYKWAVVYFFFMPFVSAASILAFENFKRLSKSLRPLAFLLYNNETSAGLVALREECKEEVRQVAEILHWVPDDYEGEFTPTGEGPESPLDMKSQRTFGAGKIPKTQSALNLAKLTRQASGESLRSEAHRMSKSWLSGPTYDWFTSEKDY